MAAFRRMDSLITSFLASAIAMDVFTQPVLFVSSPNNATARFPTTGSGPLVLPPACARKISSAVKAHSSMISTPPSWMENLRLGPGGPRLLLSWAKTRRLRSSGSQPTKMMLRAALRKSLEPRMRSLAEPPDRLGLLMWLTSITAQW